MKDNPVPMSTDLAIKPARPGSRIVGLVLDASLCAGGFIVGLSLNELMVEAFLDGEGGLWSLFWLWVICPALIGYFIVSFAIGRSLGMKAASIWLTHRDDQQRPGLLMAIPRALLTFSLVAAPIMLAVIAINYPPSEGVTFSNIIVVGLPLFFLLLNAINYLWMLHDDEHQTLLDHLLGLIVLEAWVSTPSDNDVAVSHV